MTTDLKEPRLSLDDVPGDWLTHKDFVAWSGLSKNAAYELLRRDPFRQAVRRFGRQIRINKRALAQIMEVES